MEDDQLFADSCVLATTQTGQIFYVRTEENKAVECFSIHSLSPKRQFEIRKLICRQWGITHAHVESNQLVEEVEA